MKLAIGEFDSFATASVVSYCRCKFLLVWFSKGEAKWKGPLNILPGVCQISLFTSFQFCELITHWINLNQRKLYGNHSHWSSHKNDLGIPEKKTSFPAKFVLSLLRISSFAQILKVSSLLFLCHLISFYVIFALLCCLCLKF